MDPIFTYVAPTTDPAAGGARATAPAESGAPGGRPLSGLRPSP